MKRNVLSIFVICAGLLLQTGCAQFKVMQSNINDIKNDLDTLKQDVMTIKEHINYHNELLRLVRADQQVRFDELERNIDKVAGNIAESQMSLSKIDAKTQKLKEGWEEKARADSIASIAKLAEIESLFEIATNDFNSGRRTVAISGFQDIIKRFPDSPRAEEAQYWIAECYYFQKMYTEAEEIYIGYLKKYPHGTNICGTLFKLGLIYDVKKKNDSKKKVWEKLLEQCPDAKEAEIVQDRMKGK